MNKILEFLKSIFSRSPKYTLGAFKNPSDYRNIQLASLQQTENIPAIFRTELPGFLDQGSKPKCVASGISMVLWLFNGVQVSDDDLYEQCKQIDGLPGINGTYPYIGAKVACNSGVASLEAYNSGDPEKIAQSRKENKLQGYSFVEATFEAIARAIFNNKVIVATFGVGYDWFSGIITKVLSIIGRHLVILNGYDMTSLPFIIEGQNSWGIKWIGYIAGIFDSRVKPGQFNMRWTDYQDNIYDIMAFLPIPKEILEQVKNQVYVFSEIMRQGSKGYSVKKLQEKLNSLGFECGKTDGDFGKKTKQAVILFQQYRKLLPDGIVGPKTLAELNKKSSDSSKSLLQRWADAIQQHEGWYPGSRSYRNNNPGNIKFIGQTSATGKDSGGFCIFPDYLTGYGELCSLLTRAATPPDNGVYNANMTLLQFFENYCEDLPNTPENESEVYAQFVASKLGVPAETPIKNLI